MITPVKRYLCRNQEVIKFLILLLLIVIYGIVCGGCANITPKYDADGNIIGASSYGFLRTIKIHQKRPDGSEILLETQSNTGEVLGGANSLVGTGVGAVRDLTP